MMRVLKYTYITIKILFLPVVLAFLIYFRGAIFQPHISQYADNAQDFIEQRYNISIPVHVVENNDETLESGQLTDEAEVPDSELMLTESVAEKILPASIKPENEIAEVEVKSVADRQRVVEQEILIILNGDNSNNSNQAAIETTVDEVKTGSGESLVKPDVVEASDVLVESASNKLVEEDKLNANQKVVEVNNNDIDPAIMEKLSDTVDIINRKVDMLFDINEMSNETKAPTKNSEDVAIIKKQKIKTESVDAPVVTSSEAAPLNARDMLLVARQTFWNGNPVDSEKLYLDLVDLQGNNPNLYGELGNVYYSQGKWEQAGKAYYEAAIRLLDLKQTQQVNYLLRVIQGLDVESAEKLKMKISG